MKDKNSVPQDPMLADLVNMARRRKFTRRAVFAGMGGTAAAFALSGCAQQEADLVWHNWDLYMDEDDEGNRPTLDRFTEQTGLRVDYKIEIDDNDSYFGKVKDQLELGQDIGADLTTPTDWMASRWVSLGYVQKLDAANIPNKANLDPSYLGASWDPNRDYSMPYQGIIGGIGYNKEAYKAATGKEAPESIADLFDPALEGRVGALSEMRDTVGLVLLSQGIKIDDPSSLTEDAFMAAVEFIQKMEADGKLFNIKGQSYADDFRNDQIIAAIAWSGDMTGLNFEAESEKYGFVIPDSGSTISSDTFLVPVGSTQKANAEALINYYYDPVNAAELAAWVNYVTPVVGAKEAMLNIDAELAENELIFPSEETLAKLSSFRPLAGAEEQRFSAAWARIIAGV